MDSLDYGELFANTGIDIYTREADVLIAPELTVRYGSINSCFKVREEDSGTLSTLSKQTVDRNSKMISKRT
jgi:hypothetical protein